VDKDRPPAEGVTTDWRLERHACLPSTHALIVARAMAGEADGLAVLALEQQAGRGRAGRGWVSPPGNLHLSVLLRPGGPAREAPQWSLLAGVALREAAAELAPGPFALKWPNDLLRGGAKCAGILSESALTPDGRIDWLTFGIGANLAHAPALPDRPTATLGATEPPEEFARRLLARLGAWRDTVAREGFAPVRAAWMAHGPRLGDPIALRDGPAGTRYAGLAEDGALLIDTNGTRRAIHAGEVAATGGA
jgi:BirA family biotin operon repressor/biotin-[acetyl-CoA-carboxylase] ligase